MLRDTGGDRTVRVSIGASSTYGQREELNDEVGELGGSRGINVEVDTIVIATGSLVGCENNAEIEVADEDGENAERYVVRDHRKERRGTTRILLGNRR